jgi:preprotein translocase subunit SecG
VFMLTSLSLAILAKDRTFSSTVIDLNKKPAPAESAAPASGGESKAPASGESHSDNASGSH